MDIGKVPGSCIIHEVYGGGQDLKHIMLVYCIWSDYGK